VDRWQERNDRMLKSLKKLIKKAAPVIAVAAPFAVPALASSPLARTALTAGIGALSGQSGKDILRDVALTTAAGGIQNIISPTESQQEAGTGGLRRFLQGAFGTGGMTREQAMESAAETFKKQGITEIDSETLAKEADKILKEQSGVFRTGIDPLTAAQLGLGVASLMADKDARDDYMESREYDPSKYSYAGIEDVVSPTYLAQYSKDGGAQKAGLKEKLGLATMGIEELYSTLEPFTQLLGFASGGNTGQKVDMGDGTFKNMSDFPRMYGTIKGPGDGQSDSIPAMLSNGEHVLTKQEVTQIGNGSNELGHKILEKERQNLRQQANANGIGLV